MRHILTHFAIVLSSLVAISCSNQPAESANSSTATDYCDHPEDSVSHVLSDAPTAYRNMQSYDSVMNAHWNKDSAIQYFTIRAVDLLAAMGMDPHLVDKKGIGFKHIRAYLGYNPQNSSYKLYLVPVSEACMKGSDPKYWRGGTDVLLDKSGTPRLSPIHKNPHIQNDLDGYVLDLNAPCPNTCLTDATLIKYAQP